MITDTQVVDISAKINGFIKEFADAFSSEEDICLVLTVSFKTGEKEFGGLEPVVHTGGSPELLQDALFRLNRQANKLYGWIYTSEEKVIMGDTPPDFLKEIETIVNRHNAPEQLADLQSELTAFIEKRKSENLYLPVLKDPNGKLGGLCGLVAKIHEDGNFIIEPVLDYGLEP